MIFANRFTALLPRLAAGRQMRSPQRASQLQIKATKTTRALALEKFIGVHTPFDDATHEQQKQIAKQIVAQHRIGSDLAFFCFDAWIKLQEYPQEVLEPPTVGLLFEHCLAQTLAACDWRRGKQYGHEKDIVCIPDALHSFEIKTSSQWKSDAVCGPPSVHSALQAYLEGRRPAKVRDGYHLLISYQLDTMRLHKIRFGWLQDVDFVMHTSAISTARCPAKVANIRLLTLYDDSQRYPTMIE